MEPLPTFNCAVELGSQPLDHPLLKVNCWDCPSGVCAPQFQADSVHECSIGILRRSKRIIGPPGAGMLKCGRRPRSRIPLRFAVTAVFSAHRRRRLGAIVKTIEPSGHRVRYGAASSLVCLSLSHITFTDSQCSAPKRGPSLWLALTDNPRSAERQTHRSFHDCASASKSIPQP